jgi:hypothetical protein
MCPKVQHGSLGALRRRISPTRIDASESPHDVELDVMGRTPAARRRRLRSLRTS